MVSLLLFRWHIRENINRHILESIKVTHQTLYTVLSGSVSLWFTVILNENILEWGSEEIIIPYRSPVDGKVHRYFPDFYIKVRESTGYTKKYIIEIKPKKQTAPPKKPKRQTSGYLREAYEYAKNQAKWEAASEWCKDRSYIFKVFTEKELGIK